MNPDEQITTVEISKYYKYTYVVAECNPLRYFLFVKFTCSIVCKQEQIFITNKQNIKLLKIQAN